MENQIKIKCVICAFDDDQDDIIETVDGYCHQECLADQVAKYGGEPAVDEETND